MWNNNCQVEGRHRKIYGIESPWTSICLGKVNLGSYQLGIFKNHNYSNTVCYQASTEAKNKMPRRVRGHWIQNIAFSFSSLVIIAVKGTQNSGYQEWFS